MKSHDLISWMKQNRDTGIKNVLSNIAVIKYPNISKLFKKSKVLSFSLYHLS